MRREVVIVGGGPGGAVAAMCLLREGLRPVIVEKEAFPRYHIGESMTGEAGNLLRRMGLEDRMLQDRHPQKQGVRVFGGTGRNAWFVPVMGRAADGSLEDGHTWQVRRSGFDRMMLDEALARGAELLPGRAVDVLRSGDDHRVHGVRVHMRDGGVQEVRSDLLIDASGQQTFLAHQGVASQRRLGRYDRQIAVFSQVANTIRDAGPREMHGDNTLIFYASKFRWAWFIPLDDEVVSVGVVIPGAYFVERGESRHDFLLRELRELHPELSRRLPDLTLLEEARAIPNYSYHVSRFSGPGWLCIGDTHRFIDPIFSFGLYVSMREAELAAPIAAAWLGSEHRTHSDPFAAHARRCEAGLDNLQDLIDGFWEHPLGFAHLVNGQRTKADLIDLFAGRIYMDAPSQGVRELQGLARAVRETTPA